MPGTDDEKAHARKAVIELVCQRQRFGDAAALRLIAQSPLSQERLNRLRREIREGVLRHRMWPMILLQERDSGRAASIMPEPLRMKAPVHRDYLIDATSISGDYGEWIAQDMVHRESQRLIYELEQRLPQEQMPFSLASPQEAIRRAVGSLAQRGVRANLVILPPNDRFAFALFRRPAWDASVGRRSDWGEASLGVWEGLTVVRCPYSNTSSIVVADSRTAFGWVEQPTDEIEVAIVDVPDEAKAAFLSKVTDVGLTPLPDSADLRVETIVSLHPKVGFADLRGAVRVDVTGGDACFAMEPDDNLYHRAGCVDLEGADPQMFSLTKRLEGEAQDRVPCDVCKPDQWDREAAQGLVSPS